MYGREGGRGGVVWLFSCVCLSLESHVDFNLREKCRSHSLQAKAPQTPWHCVLRWVYCNNGILRSEQTLASRQAMWECCLFFKLFFEVSEWTWYKQRSVGYNLRLYCLRPQNPFPHTFRIRERARKSQALQVARSESFWWPVQDSMASSVPPADDQGPN